MKDKIDKLEVREKGGYGSFPPDHEIFNKINELIDVVNRLTDLLWRE